MADDSKAVSGSVTGGAGNQETVRNYCFGCGADNSDGMGLNFVFDKERQSFICHFNLSARYVGPPGHAHGGIIATILDEAMGKANRIRSVTAVTKELRVEYLRPVPLGKALIAEGWHREVDGRGREHLNVAEIRTLEGQVLARSEGIFVAIDPHKMFARHMKAGGDPWSAPKQAE